MSLSPDLTTVTPLPSTHPGPLTASTPPVVVIEARPLLAVVTSPAHFSPPVVSFSFFFFKDTATPEISTLSLHDALPILPADPVSVPVVFTTPALWLIA